MAPIRFALAFLLATAAVPTSAQPPADAVAEALATIARHQVSRRVGCSIPVPALWNAPPAEQHAAFRRRQGFEDCLGAAMDREAARLDQLSGDVEALRAEHPDGDWLAVVDALDAKWAELDGLRSKLATRQNWANTAVSILDTFTGPGAPFDTGRASGYAPYSPYQPYPQPSPYGYYRPDSSVSARGIR